METATEERSVVPPVAALDAGRPARSTAVALFVALRPQEWIKNVLVYAGLLFSGKVDELAQVGDATLVFIAFCAISSAGYLFNDLRDVENDRRHPEKRHRPIAAGELAPSAAWGVAVPLAAVSIVLPLASVSAEAAGLIALYGLSTAAYSMVLKRLVIIDVMTIASLFILRVVAGAVAVEAQASEFLLVCTAMLALFLGFTKRRQEAMEEMSRPAASSASRPWAAGSEVDAASRPGAAGLEGDSASRPGAAGSEIDAASRPAAAGSEHDSASRPRGERPGSTRPVLEHYSLPFLDQMVAMVTAAAILSYIIYSVDSPIVGSEMLATAPSVLYGIFRYLYLIYDRRDTRSTAAILTEDPGMIFAGATWVTTAIALLYIFN